MVNIKLLERKEVSHLSKDIMDKCKPIGFINLYSLFPKSRYGTDTGIVFDCSGTDCDKIKRNISSRGECDIIIALSSKGSLKRDYPGLKEIIMDEPGDKSMIIKDSCPQFRKVEYPEPTGGEKMIKRDLDTHRVVLKKFRNVPDIKISAPQDVVNFVREMEDYDRERFKVIYLDNKNRVIGVENISEGTINAALIHPREAVKGAVLANSAGVVLIHNHPSGIPAPSRDDDLIIPRLFEGFGLLSIDVTDALIVGKEGYYSYKETGRLPGKGKGDSDKIMERQDDKCSIALKAAMSTIQDYCGEPGEKEIDIGGVKIKVHEPESVMQVNEDPEMSREQKVKAVHDSKWSQDEAAGLCSKLMGLTPGAKEYTDCIERVSLTIAEGLISE